MTGEQMRAREIVIKHQFQQPPLMFEEAKKHALITVTEILTFLSIQIGYCDERGIEYYKQVKKEIEAL